jgi:putative nucleotidyltransferase with HDIG domain
MNVLELKRLIGDGELLSPLPEMAVDLLRLRQPTPPLLAAIVQFATDDPPLAAELLVSVGLPAGEGGLADAVARLELPALRRVIFRTLLPRLFPDTGAGKLDRQEFWRHSMATAALAEALARRVGNAWLDHVYVAGLLHDIGKLVLDETMPEPFDRARARSRTESMFPLEAERREMGVDHTLAGKWLAEAWKLPDVYVAAIWFHHHPVGSLDETDYPIGLIDLVALADALIYENRTGAGGPSDAVQRDLRIQRLGFSKEEVAELVRDADLRRTQKAALPAKPGRTLVPRGTPQDMERKLHRLSALADLHLQFAPGATEDQILDALCLALRKAFSIAAGSVVMTEQDGGVHGRIWRSLPAPLESFTYGPPENGDPSEDPFLRIARSLSTAEDSGGSGLTSIPVLGQGQRLGHVIFDATRSDLGSRQEDYDDLLGFAGAGGNALLHARAEHELRQRTEELAASLWKEEMAHRRRLRSERLTIIGRMSSGAAHEINNPLAVIMGRAQMLLNRVHGVEEAKSLEIIADQARRVSRILSDLMQFARPPRPRLQPVHVNGVVQTVLAARRDQLNAKRIQVREEYTENLPRVRLDRYQMEQVLVQLFVNAEQAMEETGGTLRVATLGGEERRSVQIRLEDTGAGMAPEVLEHCFEPFFTTKRPGQGTGLGLSVCHGIIEAHGGSIGLVSEPNRGTSAVINLPAVADLAVVPDHIPAPEAAPEPLRNEPALEDQTESAEPAILLVGHDVELRQVLEEILRYRGCNVQSAATGMEAFGCLSRRMPDLILLDLDLPNQRGLHLLREIRQRTGTRPIVVLASPSTADREDALRLGARSLFHKPFEMARLLVEIQGLLRIRAA